MRESEWTTVRRGKGRQRERQRDGEDPRLNYASARTGFLHKYHTSSWREKRDITTYYFTRFPDHTTAKDLWTYFKKWGDVREIFIPNHRNQGGRRYGFARFKDVLDEHELARKLDNLIIDGLKLYVNLPKYGRRKMGSEQHVDKLKTKQEGHNTEGRNEHHKPTMFRTEHKTYAEVTANNNPMVVGQRRQPRPTYSGQTQSQSTIQLQVDWGKKEWLKEAWVGRLEKANDFERVEDEITWDLGLNVVPKYIGDDMVLILGLSNSKARKLQHLFHSLEKWNPNMKPGYRVIWAQC